MFMYFQNGQNDEAWRCLIDSQARNLIIQAMKKAGEIRDLREIVAEDHVRYGLLVAVGKARLQEIVEEIILEKKKELREKEERVANAIRVIESTKGRHKRLGRPIFCPMMKINK